MFLGIYIGGTSLFYYSLPLSLFSVIGYLFIGMAAEKWGHGMKKVLIPLGAVVYAGVLMLAWNLSMNTDYAKQKEEGFYLYKFRTMTNECDENGKLLPDEIRLTKFGRFLRSTSLDELPEAFNILKN